MDSPFHAPSKDLDPTTVHPSLWRAGALAKPIADTVPTGFALLDAALPGNGWARSMLTELLAPQAGVGEVQLLAPVLAGESGQLVLIAPPHAPCAPAWAHLALPLGRLTVVAAKRPIDRLWAAEAAIRDARAAALVLWCSDVTPAQLRRLQLASQGSGCLLFVVRHLQQLAQASPAPLRLTLAPADGRTLLVGIPKRQGPALDRPLRLTLPKPMPLRGYGNRDRAAILQSLHSFAHALDRNPSAAALS